MNIYQNKDQLKNLSPSGYTLAFCYETYLTYVFVSNGTTYAIDDVHILATGAGGSTRWVSTAYSWTPVPGSFTAGTHSSPEFVMSVSGDLTTVFRRGAKIRLDDSVNGVNQYFGAGYCVYSGGVTTIYLYGGTGATKGKIGGVVTNVNVSYSGMPEGWDNNPENWKIEFTSSAIENITTLGTWHDFPGYNITVPRGPWVIDGTICLYLTGTGLLSLQSAIDTVSGVGIPPDTKYIRALRISTTDIINSFSSYRSEILTAPTIFRYNIAASGSISFAKILGNWTQTRITAYFQFGDIKG